MGHHSRGRITVDITLVRETRIVADLVLRCRRQVRDTRYRLRRVDDDFLTCEIVQADERIKSRFLQRLAAVERLGDDVRTACVGIVDSDVHGRPVIKRHHIRIVGLGVRQPRQVKIRTKLRKR